MTKRLIRILNLGAGIGSTTVFLLAREGMIDQVTAAIFADTQEEPAAVYHHLQWLVGLGSPQILIRTAGKLGDDLIAGTNAAGDQRKGGRFASIPAFTASHHEDRGVLSGCNYGRIQRQCTRDYKADVVEECIRRDLLGLAPRRHVPKNVEIVQLFGISTDEAGRAVRIKKRFEKEKWATPAFPLLDLGLSRDDCVAYLAKRVPHETPRSACVFCPFRSPEEWLHLKQADPAGWARAVAVDEKMRDPQSRYTSGMREALYLHRQCIPLPMVDLEAEVARRASRPKQPDLFASFDCGEGMCGV